MREVARVIEHHDHHYQSAQQIDGVDALLYRNMLRECRHALSISAERTVFISSIAIVIGPTPPGTGVISDATWFTPSKSTSPTRRVPFFAEESGIRFIPTSTTIAPGFTISAVMSFALPAATM